MTFKHLKLLLTMATAFFSTNSFAADYPSRPITIIVPYGASGPTDLFARQIATDLGTELNQSIVVQNLAGAGGNIGMQHLERAASDGYTLGVISAAQAGNMTYNKTPGYDLDKNFKLVSVLGVVPCVFLAHPDFKVENMADLIDFARNHPGGLEFGAGGWGGSTQLSGSILEKMAGVKLNYINYKSSGDAYNDLSGGHIRLAVADLGGGMRLIKSGRAIPLAVTSPERSEYLPNVPTVAETLPGYQSVGWYALVVSSKAPPEVVAKLRQSAEKALARVVGKDQLEKFGANRSDMTTSQKDAFLTNEVDRWRTVIQEAGILPVD